MHNSNLPYRLNSIFESAVICLPLGIASAIPARAIALHGIGYIEGWLMTFGFATLATLGFTMPTGSADKRRDRRFVAGQASLVAMALSAIVSWSDLDVVPMEGNASAWTGFVMLLLLPCVTAASHTMTVPGVSRTWRFWCALLNGLSFVVLTFTLGRAQSWW